MNDRVGEARPLAFFALVFALSVPFWIAAAVVGHPPAGVPMGLPISALGAICPVIAALVLEARRRVLLRRTVSFDWRRWRWLVPTLLLQPAVMLASYGAMRVLGRPLPQPHVPLAMAPLLFAVFLVGGFGEETGWMGYAYEPLRARWGALKAALLLGGVCAVWHVVPLIQTQRPAAWIAWQCFTILVSRIFVVWIYGNTGSSVLAAILFHAMGNVSNALFPNLGSHYDPAVTGVILAVLAAGIVALWGPESLARWRFARAGQG